MRILAYANIGWAGGRQYAVADSSNFYIRAAAPVYHSGFQMSRKKIFLLTRDPGFAIIILKVEEGKVILSREK